MERLRFPMSVKRRLNILVFLASGVALLLAAIVYSVYQVGQLREEESSRLDSLSQLITQQSRVAMARGESTAMGSVLESLRTQGIVAAHLYGPDGRPLVGFGSTSAVPGLANGLVPASDHLIATRPVFSAGEMLGSVILESDPHALYARLARQGVIGAGIMALSFLGALALSARVRGAIVEPIQRLTRSVDAVSEPAGSVAAHAAAGDELDVLAHAVDELVEGIRRRDGGLRASEERYRTLMDTTGDALFLCREDGQILDANRQACESLLYRRDEIVGRHISVMDKCWHQPGGGAAQARAGLDSTVTAKAAHRRSNGSEYTAQLRLVRYREDEHVRMLIVSRDVSAREREAAEMQTALRAAESAERAKAQLLANVHREIRTPMTSVVAMSGLFSRSRLDEAQSQYVAIAKTSAGNLLDVIDDILELSWLTAGEPALDSLEFSPIVLLDDVLDLFAQRARSKGIELAARAHPSVPPSLRGDPRHLKQVLINLVGNAIKFTEHGHVQVAVRSVQSDGPQPELRFTVDDTGIGVPAELHETLFEAFKQRESHDGSPTAGLGIGLTISRSLVDLMGGRIGVGPAAESGAQFWFTAKFERPTTLIKADDSKADDSAVGVSILLLEPNRVVRAAVAEQLINLEARVAAFSGSTEALNWLDTAAAVDLVIAALPANDDSAQVSQAHEFLRQAGQQVPNAKLGMLAPLGVSLNDLSAPSTVVRIGKPVRLSGLSAVVLDALTDKSMPPVAENVSPQPATAGHKGHVLVVDDDAEIRKSLSLVIRALGYRCSTAVDGREALLTLTKHGVDALLIDCRASSGNGWEITAKLRASDQPWSTIPVFGMTAHAIDGDKKRSLDVGMTQYLTKPIPVAMLENLLSGYLVDGPNQDGKQT